MKKTIFLALILIGFFSFAQDQLKITYEGQYSLDETNSNTRFPGVFVPSNFELIIADGLAEFKYIEKLLSEVEGS